MNGVQLSRRVALRWFGVLGSGAALLAARRLVSAACSPTNAQVQGPFYIPHAPLRNKTGEGLRISGAIYDAETCAPVPGALIERWHANPFGIYEDCYSGKMIADNAGTYSMASVMPGLYGGVQRHVHFRVVVPGYEELVTQFYLDNENPTTINTVNLFIRRKI